jgi:hypothetical protein
MPTHLFSISYVPLSGSSEEYKKLSGDILKCERKILHTIAFDLIVEKVEDSDLQHSFSFTLASLLVLKLLCSHMFLVPACLFVCFWCSSLDCLRVSRTTISSTR